MAGYYAPRLRVVKVQKWAQVGRSPVLAPRGGVIFYSARRGTKPRLHRPGIRRGNSARSSVPANRVEEVDDASGDTDLETFAAGEAMNPNAASNDIFQRRIRCDGPDLLGSFLRTRAVVALGKTVLDLWAFGAVICVEIML